jgi:hypothetical protein
MNAKPGNTRKNPPEQAMIKHARRNMLKKGIGLAPVVLTLASRPVLAQFKSPSAWGSEQLMPAGASRHTNALPLSTWGVSNWLTNTPHSYLGKPWKKINSSYEDVAQLAELTVGNVLTFCGLVVPPDVNPGTRMLDLLRDGSSFQKRIVVAQLNARYDSSVSSLIPLETLKQMANGSFSPPHLSVVWDRTTIASYLRESGVAI